MEEQPMRVREIKGSRLARMLGVAAITLYPFVLFRDAAPGPALVNHERIHVAQVHRHGALRFYAGYLWQYAKGRLRGLGHAAAYRAISYEAEAYAHQHDPGYPSTLLRAGPERMEA
jgi:hypothetical protein